MSEALGLLQVVQCMLHIILHKTLLFYLYCLNVKHTDRVLLPLTSFIKYLQYNVVAIS